MAKPEAAKLRAATPGPQLTVHVSERAPEPRPLLRLCNRLLLGLTLLFIAFSAAHPLHCTDFFWHLTLGEVITETGTIPHTDLFSAVEPERVYVQFNWLWDSAAALVHSIGGLQGIRAMQCLTLSLTFIGLALWLRKHMFSSAWVSVLIGLGFLLFEDRFRARPDALTAAFTCALLPLILRARRGYRRSDLLYAFSLSLLWSNVHGGAAVLLLLTSGALAVGMTLRLWVFPAGYLRPTRKLRALSSWWLVLVSGLGLLMSPTTVPGIGHWLNAIQPQMEIGNEEWMPTYTILRHGYSPAHLWVALLPSVVVVACIYSVQRGVRRRGRAGIEPELWLLAAGYLVLAHVAVRNAFLCFIPLLVLCLRPLSPRLRRASAGRPAAIGALIALLLLGIAFQDGVYRAYGGLRGVARYYAEPLSPDTYPVHAARFVREAQLAGSVVNDGRWGGYLIHALYPQNGVFVDTRHHLQGDMWRVFNDTHSASRQRAGFSLGFARYGLELAVFPGPVFAGDPAAEWQLLYKAGPQEVYQHRRGPHAAANIERAAHYVSAQRAQLPAPLLQLAGDEGQAGQEALAIVVGAAAYLAEPRQQYRFEEAASALAARDPVERARGYRIRGRLWLSAGLYGAALSDYEAALALQPQRAEVRARLALCHLYAGRPQAARAMLRDLSPAAVQPLTAAERVRLATLSR